VYYVNATANDTFGNVGVAAFKNITVDLTDPTADFVTLSDSAGLINRTYLAVNVSGTDDNMANVTVRLYNASFSLINITTMSGSWSFQNTSGLVSNVTYYANATVVDLSGRVGYSATREFNLTAVVVSENFSFTITKPLSGCSENWGCSTPGCSECEYPFFNNSKYINYNTTPFGQNESVPFWLVNNTGSEASNVTIQLNQTSYPGIKFKVVTAYTDNEHVCSNTTEPSGGCMYVVDTSIHTVSSNISVGEIVNVWMFTDFVGVPGGTSVDRNITVDSVDYES